MSLSWDHRTASYEIYFALKGKVSGREVHGTLYASWKTKIDNVPRCVTPRIAWSATR